MAISMLFPGQGSQAVGMIGALESDSGVRDLFSEASDVLGYDLFELVQAGPAEQLNKTMYTQPALLVTSVAFYNHWLSQGGEKPSVMTGHSLGEWSALVCAGAISFKDGVRLVQKRGELMQAAGDLRPGAMAAVIGLTDDEVVALCASITSGSVTPANYNSVGQVVVSGDVLAVEELVVLAKSAGAKLAVKLPVSVASHSLLMQPAAEKFTAFLDGLEIKEPLIPVIHNYDVLSHTDPVLIRQVLLAQLVSPVRWVECMGALRERGIGRLIECGPGKVLTGLAKRTKPAIAPAMPFFSALAENENV